MKIDWELVIAFLIAMAIFKVLDKVILDSLVSKVGGMFENIGV